MYSKTLIKHQQQIVKFGRIKVLPNYFVSMLFYNNMSSKQLYLSILLLHYIHIINIYKCTHVKKNKKNKHMI